MDRQQTLQHFWDSFGYPAYEENSVPDDAVFPYFTYEKIFANIDNPITITASLWTRSDSWSTADMILNRVYDSLIHGGKKIKFDRGIMWITVPDSGSFGQSMADETDALIKRYVINLALNWLNE